MEAGCHKVLFLTYILSPSFTRGTHALDGDGNSTGLASDMIESCRKGALEVRKAMELYVNICQREGVDYQTTAVFGTMFGRTIVRGIWKNSADSLVIAFHGMGNIKRALLGCSSNYVIRRSPVLVGVVPPLDDHIYIYMKK